MLDWRHPPRIGVVPWPSSSRRPSSPGGGRRDLARNARGRSLGSTPFDWERARDRVAAAERRIDNDLTNNRNWGRAGLERAQLELSVIASQLRLRGLLE